MDLVHLKVVSAVAINGVIHKAGAIISVAEADAKALLARGKAEVATIADALKGRKPAAAVNPPVDASGLRTDGPTIAEWVAEGRPAAVYPPKGYASKSTADEIAAAVKAQNDKTAADKAAAAGKKTA